MFLECWAQWHRIRILYIQAYQIWIWIQWKCYYTVFLTEYCLRLCVCVCVCVCVCLCVRDLPKSQRQVISPSTSKNTSKYELKLPHTMYLNVVYEERHFENKIIKFWSIASKFCMSLSIDIHHMRKDCADVQYSIASRGNLQVTRLSESWDKPLDMFFITLKFRDYQMC
jgi:hypothetical protein